MVKKFLNYFEEIISMGFLAATLILVLVNIFMRYFLRSGITWSEEVATGCFVWTVYIGAAAAYKKGQHIGIDLLVNLLSEGKKKFVELVIHTILFLVIGFITYLSVKYIQTTHTKVTPVLAVSSAYISSAVTFGFVLMTLRTIQFLYNDIKNIVKGGE